MQSSSRNGAKVIWLAVHTTEGIMRARDLLNWKEWAGSSHASNDETGVLLTPADGFVAYDRAAWTLRNGNAISENIEQCGWARWTRAEWLARPKLLETTASWLADRSKARGIPLVKLSPADVKARKPGVIGHGDYSTGTGDGSHWDPGPSFPWDVVIDRAKQIAAGPAARSPQDKESDLMFHSLGPGEHMTFPRPEGGEVKVKLALDNNGDATPVDVGLQKVRVAVHSILAGHNWRNIFPGGKDDPAAFWIPQQETRGFTVTPYDDIVVIRNLHPRWNLGVTITHVL